MSEYFIRNGKSWFKFSTGREVELKQVSPMTLEAAAATVEKPKAPLQDILDPITGRVVAQERNEAHPDYKADLAEWEEKRMEAASKAAMLMGVSVEVDTAAVKAVRDQFREIFHKELDPDDRYVYIAHCLIPSREDLEALGAAINGRSRPGEAGVAKALEGFRPDV